MESTKRGDILVETIIQEGFRKNKANDYLCICLYADITSNL